MLELTSTPQNVAITHSLATEEGGMDGISLYGGTIVLKDDAVSGYYVGVDGYYANSYLHHAVSHNVGYGIVTNGANTGSDSIFPRGNNTVVANRIQDELGPLTSFSVQ
jgi:hypothetical protein